MIKKVIDLHIFSEIGLCVTLIHYPKYNSSPSDSLQLSTCMSVCIYEAKSLDHKIKVTDLHILDEVNLCVTLVHYTKHDVHLSVS